MPAQVSGSRAGDDVNLRRRLVRVARGTAVAAAAVLGAGYLLVAPHRGRVDASAEPGPTATPSTSTPSLSRPPVALSATGTSTSPVVWQVVRTGDRAKDAALAGYRAYVGTSVRLGEEPDPADPALPQVATDPELNRLRRGLSVSSDSQISRRGRVVVTARVVSLSGRQAVVVSCANFAAQHLYDGAQRRVAWRGGVVVTTARLQSRAGQWKVYLVTPMSPARCHR
jgi:hypothetical protein